MSDNIQENRKKISQLRKFIISQLKTAAWSPRSGAIHHGFSNNYISFIKEGDWEFYLNFTGYDTSSRYSVSDFISPLTFWFLRMFYVKKSLRNYHKLKKEAQLASVSKKFFDKNKDLDRDSKLDQILN
jgi:hypothetical protein